MNRRARSRLQQIFAVLFETHGPQHWWPGDSPFEVMVGAVLTQNTAWINVERAIDNLKHAEMLAPLAIAGAPPPRLAELLKPSGYFNIKARRLQNYCRWYLSAGEFQALNRLQTTALREALLSVSGVGPETADDILLYAFDRPVFVIDAYTRRILSRIGLIEGGESYEQLRRGIEGLLERDARLFNEFHALIVRHGKYVCRKRPACGECRLSRHCAHRKAAIEIERATALGERKK